MKWKEMISGKLGKEGMKQYKLGRKEGMNDWRIDWLDANEWFLGYFNAKLLGLSGIVWLTMRIQWEGAVNQKDPLERQTDR